MEGVSHFLIVEAQGKRTRDVESTFPAASTPSLLSLLVGDRFTLRVVFSLFRKVSLHLPANLLYRKPFFSSWLTFFLLVAPLRIRRKNWKCMLI